MIDYNFAARNMDVVSGYVNRQIDTEMGNAVLANSLYVFGARQIRDAHVYLSPEIPDVARLAEFIERKAKVTVTVQDFGTTTRRFWVALRTDLRIKNPKVCAKICVLTLYSLNNLINW